MRVRSCLFAVTASLGLVNLARAQPTRQPEVVCDLVPILAGAFDGARLSRHELVRENAETIRLTFRDIDPKAGTARMIIGEGASGEMDVAVTVDAGAIVYLQEKPGVSKMIVSTANRATSEGWPAVISQHGWSGGELTIRAPSGLCRMRAR